MRTQSAASIPLPAAALLAPLPEPDCRLSTPESDDRQRLDYERQCYRHAEIIARTRLQQLQSSVEKIGSASNRGGSP